MKLIESIRKHPYRYGTGVVLLAGTIALEKVGFDKNPTYALPLQYCASPFAVSDSYNNVGGDMLRVFTGAFIGGVEGYGNIPKDTFGIRASFMHTGGTEAELEANASALLQADDAGNVIAKWAVGAGSMRAAAQVIAPVGSEECDKPPQITWRRVNATDYFLSDGLNPWDNGFNVLTRFPAW